MTLDGLKKQLYATWLTIRLIPLINWTGINSMLALALAVYFVGTGRIDLVSWLVAAFTAWMTQGFPAHIWNDIFDWIHGTDKLVDIGKSITGGSRAVQLYYKDNLWKHLVDHWPWLIALVLAVYWFGYVKGWWWYVTLGVTAAVYISVFYSTPPICADHRPFWGEWLHAFPGILVCDVLLYYAAAHVWPPLVAVLVMALYAAGNVFMLELHHVNDIYPDLHAQPRKKYTGVSWLYERYGWDAVVAYLTYVAIAGIVFGCMVAALSSSLPLTVAVTVLTIMWVYGVGVIADYADVDVTKYPDYLAKTIPLEVKWIKFQTLMGALAALVLATGAVLL